MSCCIEPDLSLCRTGPCCPDINTPENEAIRLAATKIAATLISRLTGNQFATTCDPITIRPCHADSCCDSSLAKLVYSDSRLGNRSSDLGVLSYTPTLVSGEVFNLKDCGACGSCCSCCKPACSVSLGTGICEIVDVVVGTQHLGKNQYDLYSDGTLGFRGNGVQRHLALSLPLPPGVTEVSGGAMSNAGCGISLDDMGNSYDFEFAPNKQDVQWIIENPVGNLNTEVSIFQPQNFDYVVLSGGNPVITRISNSRVRIGPATVPDENVRVLFRAPKNGTARSITIKQETVDNNPIRICELQWTDYSRQECGVEVGSVVPESFVCPGTEDAATIPMDAIGATEGPPETFVNAGPTGMELNATDDETYYCAATITLEADTALVVPSFELADFYGITQDSQNTAFTGNQVAVSFGVPVDGNTVVTGPVTGLPITVGGGTVTPTIVSGSIHIDAPSGAPFGRQAGDAAVPVVLRFEFSEPIRALRAVVASDADGEGTVSGITGVPAVLVPEHVEWTRTSESCCPPCQDYNQPLGQEGTWSVTYIAGIEVPDDINIAAGLYACELAKGFIGQACSLPDYAQAAQRQGIDMIFVNPIDLTKAGMVGIRIVDDIIKAFNPHQLYKAATVWSTDMPTVKRIVQ